ncbi:hypothetical protein CBS101457_002913 [Exobasidium rhododendri]|nr:hypothetical protein CBS101457_002913 [Exobasidium rhododendri]
MVPQLEEAEVSLHRRSSSGDAARERRRGRNAHHDNAGIDSVVDSLGNVHLAIPTHGRSQDVHFGQRRFSGLRIGTHRDNPGGMQVGSSSGPLEVLDTTLQWGNSESSREHADSSSRSSTPSSTSSSPRADQPFSTGYFHAPSHTSIIDHSPSTSPGSFYVPSPPFGREYQGGDYYSEGFSLSPHSYIGSEQTVTGPLSIPSSIPSSPGSVHSADAAIDGHSHVFHHPSSLPNIRLGRASIESPLHVCSNADVGTGERITPRRRAGQRRRQGSNTSSQESGEYYTAFSSK